MHSTKTIILDGGVDTPLGNVLDIISNAQWLAYIMYSVPHISINLPPLDVVEISQISRLSDEDIDMLVKAILSDKASIEQMEDKGTDEAFFLAVRPLEKLAVAAYTLYLYGIR